MDVTYTFVQNGLPSHLGGHEEETHIDEGAVSKLIEKYGCQSVVDVGCGPGGMVEHFKNRGMEVLGIDGDNVVKRPDNIKKNIVIHDFQNGPYEPDKIYDLAWSVEFVEHVWPKYMTNYIATFKKCRYVIFTHAIPGQPGHHHVNCRTADYWLGVMEGNGFEVDVDTTNEVRQASTMKERYIRNTGLVFKNKNL